MNLIRNFFDDNEIEMLLAVWCSHLDPAAWKPGRQGGGYRKYPLFSYDGCTSIAGEGYSDSAQEFLGEVIAKSLLKIGGSILESWDAWLIEMPDGSHIGPHTDPHEAGDHHRINTLISRGDRGGHFSIEGGLVEIGVGDAFSFRPDIHRHEVSMVSGGVRIMFSVGCVHAK